MVESGGFSTSKQPISLANSPTVRVARSLLNQRRNEFSKMWQRRSQLKGKFVKMPIVQANRHHKRQVLPLTCVAKNMLGQGKFIMKRVFQICAVVLLLNLTGVLCMAQTVKAMNSSAEWQKPEKPPERPKERDKPKEDKRPDPPKDDKKKPNEG
jgi:hypothetical protein